MIYQYLYRPDYPYDGEVVQQNYNNFRIRAHENLSPDMLDYEINNIVDYLNDIVWSHLKKTEALGFVGADDTDNLNKIIITDGQSLQWSKITKYVIENKAIKKNHIIFRAIKTHHIVPRSIQLYHFAEGAIGDQNIANNAAITDKFKNGSVTSAKFENKSIGSRIFYIKDGSITTEKLAPKSVRKRNLWKGGYISNQEHSRTKTTDDEFDVYKYLPPAVGRDQIRDGSISAVNIRDGAITEAKICSKSVTEFELAEGAVTTDKIDDEIIDHWHLFGAKDQEELSKEDREKIAVTTFAIADGAVKERHIHDESILEQHLTGGGTTALIKIFDENGEELKWEEKHITDLTKRKIKIFDDEGRSLTWQEMLTRYYMANDINYDGIMDDPSSLEMEMIDGCVTSDKIKDASVMSDHIVSGSVFQWNFRVTDDEGNPISIIKTDHLMDYNTFMEYVKEIKGGKIVIVQVKKQEAAVSATQIAFNALTTDKFADGAVKYGRFSAKAVTSSKIDVCAVTGPKLEKNSVSTRTLSSFRTEPNWDDDGNPIEDEEKIAVTTEKIMNKNVHLKHLGKDVINKIALGPKPVSREKLAKLCEILEVLYEIAKTKGSLETEEQRSARSDATIVKELKAILEEMKEERKRIY